MAAFAYKAVNARGRNLNGVLEGDNARQVRQQLREKGLIPLEVEQVAERSQESKKGFAASLFKPRISRWTTRVKKRAKRKCEKQK